MNSSATTEIYIYRNVTMVTPWVSVTLNLFYQRLPQERLTVSSNLLIAFLFSR